MDKQCNCEPQKPAFLTGSQRYGEPTEESDIDLVIHMKSHEADRLVQVATGKMDGNGSASESGQVSLRFGKLNLLLVDDDYYDAWLYATLEAERQGPLSKLQAKRLFAHVFDKLELEPLS